MSTQVTIPAPRKPLASLPLETQIVELVRELLVEQGRDAVAATVTPKSSFQNDLGLASLDLVELVVRCESRLDVQIPDEIAEQADTAAAWAKAIRGGSERGAAKSAYRIVPPGGAAAALPESASNLIEVLQWHAAAAHGRVHAHLLEQGAGRGLTCDRLAGASERVARGLISLGLVRNDTVAVLLVSGGDFFEAFFGVMLAGGIPVPVYPPHDLSRLGEYVERQTHILRNAGIRFLITFPEVQPVTRLLRINVPTLIDVTSVADLRELGTHTSARFPNPSDVALVQYTSGTTAEPKGVVLTHGQLLANIRAIGQAVGIRADDAVVSWLPLASDMGLVGCWLVSLYHATPLTLLPARDFLEHPEIWLRAVHDSRGTLSAAPNFAYELCVRRVPMWALEGVDLSCWRVAVNAGETVLASTVEGFSRRFAPLGFRAEAMTPAYGLAENSVALAVSAPGRGPRQRDGFFSIGAPLPGHEVRIVDQVGTPVPEGNTGRLLFRGVSRCSGYFGEKFVERSEWIDSGDVAFQFVGEIYFAGRSKDVLVRGGRLIAPEPVEHAVRQVLGVQEAVAVGLPDSAAGTERLVIAAESAARERSEITRVAAGVQVAVCEHLGEAPDRVVVVGPGTLPRTANRKLRRGEVRRLIQSGELGRESNPAGVQMAGMWWDNLGALTGLALARTARSLRSVGRQTVARLAAAAGAPAPVILSALGRRPTPEGTQMRGPVVIVCHRCTQLDALSVVSLVESSCRLAGEETLYGLPQWAARSLRPLVVETPPQMETALRSGRALIVFPDSPLGTSVVRSRYRLAAFDAAIATGTPLLPLGMQIIRNRLFFRVAAMIVTTGGNARQLREQVRTAIGGIYA